MYSSLLLLLSLAVVASSHMEKKNIAAGMRPIAKAPQDIYCPDGFHTCPSDNTCCSSPSGVYYCCPFLNAACCVDGKHCCALGYSCNSDYTCKRTSIICPSKKTTCPLNNTCCPLYSGEYGCCPFVNAVCCSNEKCCRSGYYCNSDGTCSRLVDPSSSGKQPAIMENPGSAIIIDAASVVQEYSTKKHSLTTSLKRSAAKAPQDIYCPDFSTCPDKNTCCLNQSGDYACCPLPDATCCSDGKHCCNLGYSCNSDETCKQTSIVCPGRKGTCPLSTTCCLLTSGDYGCCPEVNAVCCSNNKCCPSGYYCSSDGGCRGLSLSGNQHAIESARPVVDILKDNQ